VIAPSARPANEPRRRRSRALQVFIARRGELAWNLAYDGKAERERGT